MMPSIRPISRQMTPVAKAERKQTAQDGHAQHDESCGVVAQIELMDAEGAEENFQKARRHVVFRAHHGLLAIVLPVRVVRTLGGTVSVRVDMRILIRLLARGLGILARAAWHTPPTRRRRAEERAKPHALPPQAARAARMPHTPGPRQAAYAAGRKTRGRPAQKAPRQARARALPA